MIPFHLIPNLRGTNGVDGLEGRGEEGRDCEGEGGVLDLGGRLFAFGVGDWFWR